MTPYLEIKDSDRFWLLINDVSVGSINTKKLLERINLLDELGIQWAPQEEQLNESLAIPITTIWFNPREYQKLKDFIYNFYDVHVIVKDTSKVIMSCEDLNNFDSEKLLTKGTWWNNLPVNSYLWSLDGYLNMKSEKVFEEIFYLYHCGIFDVLGDIDENMFQRKMTNIRSFIDMYIAKDPNALRGKYVKILY